MADKHFGKTKDRHIYLSTSNQASPDEVREIRRWLLERGWTIIEHDGGAYNERLLFETSMMLMIGYDTGFHTNRKTGRGQYNQLFERESYDYNSNWMLTGYDLQGTPQFHPVVTDGIMDDTAYKRDYGTFYVDIDKPSISLQNYNKVGVDLKKEKGKGVGFLQADSFGDMGKNSSYEYAILDIGKKNNHIAAINVVRNL